MYCGYCSSGTLDGFVGGFSLSGSGDGIVGSEGRCLLGSLLLVVLAVLSGVPELL